MQIEGVWRNMVKESGAADPLFLEPAEVQKYLQSEKSPYATLEDGEELIRVINMKGIIYFAERPTINGIPPTEVTPDRIPEEFAAKLEKAHMVKVLKLFDFHKKKWPRIVGLLFKQIAARGGSMDAITGQVMLDVLKECGDQSTEDDIAALFKETLGAAEGDFELATLDQDQFQKMLLGQLEAYISIPEVAKGLFSDVETCDRSGAYSVAWDAEKQKYIPN